MNGSPVFIQLCSTVIASLDRVQTNVKAFCPAMKEISAKANFSATSENPAASGTDGNGVRSRHKSCGFRPDPQAALSG